MMLQSVVDQEDQIKQILREKDAEYKAENVDFVLLRNIICFFQPLRMAKKALEGDKQPTIHRVCLWYHKLLQHTTVLSLDSELIYQLKTRMAAVMPYKFEMLTLWTPN